VIQHILFLIMSGLLLSVPSHAWHDRTHQAVVEAAGAPRLAYLAVGADMAKAKQPQERLNHYCNNVKGTVVTTKMVLDQVALYDTAEPAGGHLYGAIVAALAEYRKLQADPDKYALYPLGFAMHYIGDLSMPFHNMAYNDFNRTNHSKNDGVVDGEDKLVAEIRSRMPKYPIVIDQTNFQNSLATQVALIATRSTTLGYQLQESGTQVMGMTTAYELLAQSAALLRAVLVAMGALGTESAVERPGGL
jgi:hypothetical protein